MKIKIDPVRLCIELALIFDTNPALQKVKDANGVISVPAERYPDFCHDIGIIIGQIMKTIAETEE